MRPPIVQPGFIAALEAVALAAAGAVLAGGFIGLVLDFAGDSPMAVTLTGLLFLVWPGVANLIGMAFGAPPIDREALVWIAAAVGALTGLFDGVWSVHHWRRFGVVSFLLDTTWGLAGSANAALLHLVNLRWGRHSSGDVERRRGAHRYQSGFAPGRGFAFTLGSVMSNTGRHGPDSELFAHERIHVWQSRIAGPFFWFSYVGWMVIATPPALVVATLKRRPVGDVVQWWAYYNNPWEVMAYEAANPGVRTRGRFSDGTMVEPWACWPARTAKQVGGLGLLVLLAGFIAIMATIWP